MEEKGVRKVVLFAMHIRPRYELQEHLYMSGAEGGFGGGEVGDVSEMRVSRVREY